ncbi:coiled-coil domain-containing protein 112-like [Watersipora subatra]|uniref:coiled-coil domain-containing protein 112-like n=1 Tax=Watersipora subatra TaxID=2589382 RepID=UPI00355BBE5C
MSQARQHKKNIKEILTELKHLETRAQGINKEKETQLYKKSPSLAGELSAMDSKQSSEYSRDRLKTKKEIYQLRGMVHQFHEEIRNVLPTPEFLEKLKVIMEDIENGISLFKQSQREKYDQLMMNELQYSHEINALEKRFDSWTDSDSTQRVTAAPLTKLPSAKDVGKNLPVEVAQFSKFLEETGGPRGGWDEYDHNTFLKWRVRYHGRGQFVAEAISHLPSKTEEEVREHEKWYKEFLSHQEQKRLAISDWKRKKNEEKNEKQEQSSEASDEEEEKRLEKERIMERERLDRQNKLSSWKLEKELERAEAEERQLREESAKAEKERVERLRQQELREKVAEYKRTKLETEEFLRLEAEAQELQELEKDRERRQLDKSRVELRNQFAFEQKMRHMRDGEKKKEESLKKEQRLKSQYEVNVVRDPSRLLRPTEGWKSRTKQVGASAESGRIYTMAHRGVPSWRRGL